MMYDFREVNATSKSEQVRAWAVEQAIQHAENVMSSLTLSVDTDQVIGMATKIENYVKNGAE